MERTYFCIDMKSFYASVECADRGLNPFETNLVVADETRGRNALCLAITPKMKALGVKNRCRLSEIPGSVKYIIAPPRMQRYVDCAADIYAIYLEYFDPADIHVYSIDESFIDVTGYLESYGRDAKTFAKHLMNEIAQRQHIPSTAGIGTNLFLAKIALDITAKHTRDHIGYLNEELFRETLWEHKPITDFWMISTGTAQRLARLGAFCLHDVTLVSERDMYKMFGVNAELLIDHAWGRESCRITDIKAYKPKSQSVSFSQILPRDYSFADARVVMQEMVFNASKELMRRKVIAGKVWIGVGYGYDEMQASTKGTSKFLNATAVPSIISPYAMDLFDKVAVRNAKIRRLAISFADVRDEGCEGYDLFTNWEKVEKEKAREKAILDLEERFGKNAVLRGVNYMKSGTQRERNMMIGGHRAGYDDKIG